MKTSLISIVSPVYKAEGIVDELVKQLVAALDQIKTDYEIILVDDGSPDDGWMKIKENCIKHKRVKGIKLSRNFGQHYAVSAGLEASKGENVIVMDCDLQDNPADIQLLIDRANEGYDTVFTKRIERKHSTIKKVLSYSYRYLFKFLSNQDFSLDHGSLYLINRKVVNAIIPLKERPRLLGQVIRWVGFNIGFVNVVHQERFKGVSSYNTTKLLSLVLDGWISNSDKLLRIVIYLGSIISFLSIITGLSIIISKFFIDFSIGWSSIIVTILFSTGLILMALGVVGLYVGKTFEQTKDRPLFIVDTKLNFNE